MPLYCLALLIFLWTADVAAGAPQTSGAVLVRRMSGAMEGAMYCAMYGLCKVHHATYGATCGLKFERPLSDLRSGVVRFTGACLVVSTANSQHEPQHRTSLFSGKCNSSGVEKHQRQRNAPGACIGPECCTRRSPTCPDNAVAAHERA
jgi:hypothetical protein